MLTAHAAKFLLTNAPNSDANPFIRQNGVCILRADLFEVTPRYNVGIFKGYMMRYFWRGQCVSEQPLDAKDPKEPFTLRDIELRHIVDIRGLQRKGN